MSLATRCTSCGTVFRVVQDQLKVSEGWVRCGRCNEVFNALEDLFDLERDPVPAWPTVAAEAIDPEELAQARAAEHSDPDLVERMDAELFGRRGAQAPSPPDPASQSDPVAVPGPCALPDVAAAAVSWQRPPVARDEPANAPEFVRVAERQARWQQPGARWALGTAALLLAILLGLQVLHHFRDLSAARWPGLRPALVAWCGLAACTLGAPRRIEDVSVESSSLTRASGPDAFRLAVTLRNRGSLALALPSIDLSLTDTAGQLLARRALTPQDFSSPSVLLAPGNETALQLLLSIGSPKVTGYNVEIFYP